LRLIRSGPPHNAEKTNLPLKDLREKTDVWNGNIIGFFISGGRILIDLSVLKNRSRLVTYPKGTVLDGAMMRMLLKGEAGVISGRPGEHRLVGRLKPGDFFGEAALFLQENEPLAVVALTDIVVLPIPRDGAAAFFSEEPAFAFELCRALCARLHGRDAAASGASQSAPADEALQHETAGQEPQQASVSGAPETAPAEETPQTAASRPAGVFPLFPEGHGVCTLPMNNADREHLFLKSAACPLCGQSFEHLAVRTSKLVLKSTDSDMRPRYRDIEPLYYEVVTCPHCLYSALPDVFDKPGKPSADFLNELAEIKAGCNLRFGEEMDADSVFAGYYLALHCAPRCFARPQLITGRLYAKLSRVYQDAGNSRMEMHMAQQALDAYMYAYQNIRIPASQDQQLCLMIAELNFKLGHMREARDFFFKVKISRGGAPQLKRQAENRLYEIREGARALNQ